ncbi:hypothetical protein BpHYR1_029853 [Brachionus plicatilis]|uniref:Uncharacterized protein n=1 Tax=Brachionus plicatilis TaxID=10195 RepID=A0A3M7QH81_BRAPC|nr:hypothetical protein BpHYR1_029853 [Brachionus plicatilis]
MFLKCNYIILNSKVIKIFKFDFDQFNELQKIYDSIPLYKKKINKSQLIDILTRFNEINEIESF